MPHTVTRSILLTALSVIFGLLQATAQDQWYPVGKGVGTVADVNVFLEKDGYIYVGGYGFRVNSQPQFNDVFLYTDDLSWQVTACPSLISPYAGVNTMVRFGDDIIVGGSFTNIGGDPSLANIARWDGEQWHSMGGGLNDEVNAILVDGSDIYVGGRFSTAGGTPYANRIARWDSTTETWNALGLGITSGEVTCLEKDGNIVYAGGSFSYVDNGNIFARAIAQWNGSQWSTLTADCSEFGPNSWVTTLLLHNGQLFVGSNGSRNCQNNNPTSHDIMIYNGVAFDNLGTDVFGPVYDIEVHQGDLYIAGWFDDAGGDPLADNLARWNGTDWVNVGITPGDRVYALFSNGTDLYIGGEFINLGGHPDMDGIARLGGPKYVNQDACVDDPTIQYVEEQIADALSRDTLPADYHLFTVNTVLCDGCDLEEAWAAYTSSNIFAHPQYYDMPGQISQPHPPFLSGTYSIFRTLLSYQSPVMNCERYDIISPMNTIAKLGLAVATYKSFSQPNPIPELLDLICPDFSGKINNFSDPIRVVVDPVKKCITRYTLPGHILYPGKTTTCFLEPDCAGQVIIRTIGEGRHFCGENSAGNFFANLNEGAGASIFESNHNRFKASFTGAQSNRSIHLNTQSSSNLQKNLPDELLGRWVLQRQTLVLENEEMILFDQDATSNLFDLTHISMKFLDDGQYSGTNVWGEPMTGDWSFLDNLLTMDGQENEYIPIDTDTFQLSFITYVWDVDEGFIPMETVGTYTRSAADCIPNLSVNGNPISTGWYEAAEEITSTGTVNADSVVALEAGNVIRLQAGFKAESGSYFSARIAPCYPPSNVNAFPNDPILPNLTERNKARATMKIHPNPTAHSLTLTFTEDLPRQATLFNNAGQIVLEKLLPAGLTQEMDLSMLPSGVYFIRIVYEDSIFTKKVVKKNW